MAALGKSVPDEVGFVHLDRCDDSVAGIDQRPRDIGTMAVDLVTSRLLANERGFPSVSQHLLVGGVWMDGPTLRQKGR
jgi:hypothetical protein